MKLKHSEQVTIWFWSKIWRDKKWNVKHARKWRKVNEEKKWRKPVMIWRRRVWWKIGQCLWRVSSSFLSVLQDSYSTLLGNYRPLWKFIKFKFYKFLVVARQESFMIFFGFFLLFRFLPICLAQCCLTLKILERNSSSHLFVVFSFATAHHKEKYSEVWR